MPAKLMPRLSACFSTFAASNGFGYESSGTSKKPLLR